MASPAPRPKARVFYGWWVVFACVFVLTMTSGTGFYCYSGVFISSFEEVFGWSRAILGGTITIHWIAQGLAGPFVGLLVHRFGLKRIMLVSALITGLGLMALSRTSSWLYLYILYSIVSVGMTAGGIIPMGLVVSRWFVRRRGLAMGVVVLGIAFGGLLLVPLAQFFTTTFNWQWAYILLGLVVWVVCIPLITLVVKNSPEEMGLLTDGDEPQETASPATQPKSAVPATELWTVREASRTGAFWFISLAVFLAYGALFGTLTHQKLYHVGVGIDTSTAVLAYSLTAGMGSVGKLTFGYMSDKVPVKYVAALSFGLQAIGILLLMATRDAGMLWVYVILFGAAMGGVATLQPLLVVTAFGPASFAIIYGMISLIFHFGMALGPWAAGRIFDVTGSYQWAFISFLAAYVLATVAVLAVRQPSKQPGVNG